MKSSSHFRKVIRRENALKNGIYNVFMSFASVSRMLFEVFTRRDFGERYFRLSASLILVFFLALYPIIPMSLTAIVSGSFSLVPAARYLTWYLFLGAHVYMSIKHYKKKNINRAQATKPQYSLFAGYFNDFLVPLFSKEAVDDERLMSTFYEPALFLILGLALIPFGQSLGYLLFLNSIVYAIGYLAAYKEGDDYVMNITDQRIAEENFYTAFVEQKGPSHTCNYRFVGRAPKDIEQRKKIAVQVKDEEKVTVQ